MSTHGRSGPGLALFGSIAEAVLRGIDVPVVFVGPSVTSASNQNFEQLVVCLDGSETADAAVPVALSLSRDIDADLWLVRVADSDARAVVFATGMHTQRARHAASAPATASFSVHHPDPPARHAARRVDPRRDLAGNDRHGRRVRRRRGRDTSPVHRSADAPDEHSRDLAVRRVTG
jgi:nucleotide-binding universal stress UspA family protein